MPTTKMPDINVTYISPREDVKSTLPSSTDRVPIVPISAWACGMIPTALVFPRLLDEEKLKEAVSTLIALWPTLTGKYEKHQRPGKENEWDFSVNLTSSPIPFSTQTISTTSPAFPTLDVIQSTVEPYVPSLGEGFMEANSNAHLFAVQLTTLNPSGSCVLGINVSHVLLDGSGCVKLIHLLEKIYLHGVKSVDEQDKPTFLGHFELPKYNPEWKLPNSTLVGHEKDEWIKAYVTSHQVNETVIITLSRKEAAALRASFTKDSKEKISTQDAISAWWISILRRIGEEVDTLIYVINYREFLPNHPSVPPNMETLSSNVAQMRYIPLPPSSPNPIGNDTATIADIIRREINILRSNPDVTLPWLSNAAHYIEQAAVEDKGQILVPIDGHACINANINMKWHTTFGFPPDQTSFHTGFSTRRFLRVFQGNPRPGEKEGDRIELVFSVPKGLGWKEQIAQMVDQDKEGW